MITDSYSKVIVTEVSAMNGGFDRCSYVSLSHKAWHVCRSDLGNELQGLLDDMRSSENYALLTSYPTCILYIATKATCE